MGPVARAAFGDATLRQVMDMTTGIRFREDYADPAAEIWAHARAGNPPQTGRTLDLWLN